MTATSTGAPHHAVVASTPSHSLAPGARPDETAYVVPVDRPAPLFTPERHRS
jgi:hypothetical protein